MTLIYPGIAGTPRIVVSIEDLLTGRTFLFPMLLDTGADETCYPASYAAFFGHDNANPAVKKGECRGIGGKSAKYLHSVQVSLIHPTKSAKGAPVIAWTASQGKASFIDKFDAHFGLLGMDIIRQWRQLAIQTKPYGRLIIKITI